MKIEPMSFEEMKAQAAADLRAVAAILEDHARRVDAGDIEGYYEAMCEQMPKCQEMLMLRQAHRAERREAAREPPGARDE
jgi:hypothetical protein